MRKLAAGLAAALACGPLSAARGQPPSSIDSQVPFVEAPLDTTNPVDPRWTDGLSPEANGFFLPLQEDGSIDRFEGPPMPHERYAGPSWSIKSLWPSYWFPTCVTTLGLRHSSADGRNVGLGAPLVSTSWLNRRWYAGAEIGPLWITRRVEDSVRRDTDVFGGFYFGCDWDFYWGSELRFDWATPELINSEAPDADRADGLFAWSYNLLYYPWGDSTFRPYWRWGIGTTHFDFPTDDGFRRDETLLTIPLGVGLKYPVRRWLAVRGEFSDNLSIGDSGLPTMHNLTLTLGVECHYGVHPKSYWPWYPSRHIW